MLWLDEPDDEHERERHAQLEQPPEPPRGEAGSGEDGETDDDRGDPAGQADDQVGESEDAALPGVQVLRALDEEAEVARCDRSGIGQQVELLDA